MPITLINSRLHPNKHKPKIKQKVNNTKSNLTPHLQLLKKKLSGSLDQERCLLNIDKISIRI